MRAAKTTTLGRARRCWPVTTGRRGAAALPAPSESERARESNEGAATENSHRSTVGARKRLINTQKTKHTQARSRRRAALWTLGQTVPAGPRAGHIKQHGGGALAAQSTTGSTAGVTVAVVHCQSGTAATGSTGSTEGRWMYGVARRDEPQRNLFQVLKPAQQPKRHR